MGPDRRLRLFIYARIIVSFLFLASTLLLNYKEPASPVDDVSHMGIVRLMGFSFIFSCASHFALRIRRFQFFTIYLQSIWDVLFVTLLLLFTGGISSPYSFLYLLAIMNAGVLLGRKEALYTAALCGILYGATVDFQYFGYLEVIGLSQADAQQLGASHLFYHIFINLMGFGLSAFITGYLADQTRKSEAALRENIINYEELSDLNSRIVANIETGLLTTNAKGNIRVFNPHAEHITGLLQEDVYDRPLATIFPELAGCLDPLDEMIRGEFEYTAKEGLLMILGYSIAPFSDGKSKGTNASAIVNFRDITGIRRMEDALKRADRLAALGELSARMAHEIRNPLAAMNGSVQMLVEHGSIDDKDKRLLDIVMRESVRLNTLITDFLSYARPAAPKRETVDVKSFVEDLCLFLQSDSRFSSVEITSDIPAHLSIQADPHQLSQVFMNLLLNSAAAMPQGGRVDIETRYLLSGANGFRKSPTVAISVRDNGCGIDQGMAKHIFEPFWTTKTEGTGLGLAIIYRIIEAHGGTISVESPPGGGCCFTILLPV